MSTREPPRRSAPPVLGETLAFVRDPFELVSELTAECGPVHRLRVLGVGEFYEVTHPAGVEAVLVDERDAFRKTRDFRQLLGESVVSTEGEQWRRQRSAMDDLFRPGRIRSYADRMVTVTDRRLDRWSGGETRSLHEASTAVTLEILFATVFDRPLDPEGDEALRRAASAVNSRFAPTSFALPPWIPTPNRRRSRRAVETLRAEARRLLAERRRDLDRGEAGDDLLSALVGVGAGGVTDGDVAIDGGAEADDAGLSEQEVVDQVLGLTFAGHDTTAILLTCALHELGTHDDVRERFHDELATVLDGEAPTAGDVADLAVTGRIVDETLRAYPSVHTIPRETTRAVEIDGYRLASDTRTHVSVWGVHHSSDHWAAPDEWRPARWRDTNPQEKGYAFVPFGAGPRACLGRRFARLEATLVLARIGQRFHLDPERSLEFEPMATLQPAHGVPVTVHERG